MSEPTKDPAAAQVEEEATIEVSAETMALLQQIAAMLACTVNAALEEAIREYALNV